MRTTRDVVAEAIAKVEVSKQPSEEKGVQISREMKELPEGDEHGRPELMTPEAPTQPDAVQDVKQGLANISVISCTSESSIPGSETADTPIDNKIGDEQRDATGKEPLVNGLQDRKPHTWTRSVGHVLHSRRARRAAR